MTDYAGSPTLRRFIREPPREGNGRVALSEVKRLIEQHRRPVEQIWPVSLASRFIRTVEDKKNE